MSDETMSASEIAISVRDGFGCDNTDARVLVAAIDRLRSDLAAARRHADALARIGGLLSNCAFNLAQSDRLKAHERRSLDGCRKEWDAALTAYRAEGDGDA